MNEKEKKKIFFVDILNLLGHEVKVCNLKKQFFCISKLKIRILTSLIIKCKTWVKNERRKELKLINLLIDIYTFFI